MSSSYGGGGGGVSPTGATTGATTTPQVFSNGAILGTTSGTPGNLTIRDGTASGLFALIGGSGNDGGYGLQFDASALTATRARTLLDVAGTEVLRDATQTLSGKTLTAPVINTEPGYVALAAAFTNATSTFASTALSVNVVSGRKYNFRLVLFVSDSTAADGIKIDFNGGSAAATDFRAHATLFDTALLLSTQVTALATSITQATVTGSGMFECYGTFEPSGTGTFIVRAAQNSHSVGTLTIQRGSHLHIKDVTAV